MINASENPKAGATRQMAFLRSIGTTISAMVEGIGNDPALLLERSDCHGGSVSMIGVNLSLLFDFHVFI